MMNSEKSACDQYFTEPVDGKDDDVPTSYTSDSKSLKVHQSGCTGRVEATTNPPLLHSNQHLHAMLPKNPVEDSAEEVESTANPPPDSIQYLLATLFKDLSEDCTRNVESTTYSPPDSNQHLHDMLFKDPVEEYTIKNLLPMHDRVPPIPSLPPLGFQYSSESKVPPSDFYSQIFGIGAKRFQTTPTLPHCFSYSHHFIQSPSPPNKRRKTSSIKQCSCKKSQCLKRYCECFASGELCGPNCVCQDCFNTLEHENTIILEKRKSIQCHNPSAFAKNDDKGKSRTAGCNCTKSACSNEYCPCYKAKVGCSDLCRCRGCDNSCGRKNNGLNRERFNNTTMPTNERRYFYDHLHPPTPLQLPSHNSEVISNYGDRVGLMHSYQGSLWC